MDGMALSESIQAIVRAQRAEAFKASPQLSLGDIIRKLEAIEDQTQPVAFDFEYAFPTTLDSWRGSYAELALGFDLMGYGPLAQDGNCKTEPTAAELLEELRGAIGKEYTGWKGGEFVMTEQTPVWVANPGNTGNTGIIGVTVRDGQVVLDTAYCEY